MCFTNKKPWYTKLLGIKPIPKIALTDLYVIKVLENHNGQLMSPFQEFPYSINTLYSQKIIVEGSKHSLKNFFDIQYGLHSCTVNGLHYMQLVQFYNSELYLAKIPRGSLYYKDFSEVVSNNLIILNKIDLNTQMRPILETKTSVKKGLSKIFNINKYKFL